MNIEIMNIVPSTCDCLKADEELNYLDADCKHQSEESDVVYIFIDSFLF